MASPTIFAGQRTKLLTSKGLLLQSGQTIDNDGPINYLTPGFATGTVNNWTLGVLNGLSGSIPNGTPTFGSGASANLSVSATSSGALSDSYSLQLLSSTATTAGDMLASPAFTIQKKHQAKVLTFKFYYSATSGTANANWSGTNVNSFGVAIYDVTNSTWINPAGCFGMTQGSGVGVCTGTFQTPSNGSQFRIVVYNANATSGAITMLFDDFSVGPQTAPIGAIATDWKNDQTFPPNGFGTVSGASYWYRRLGDSAEVTLLFTSGTVAASTASIALPFTIDSTKLPTGATAIGIAYREINAASRSMWSNNDPVVVFYDGATTSVVYLTNADGAQTFTKTNASSMYGTGDVLSIKFTVPVQGWSSNVQMSSDTDTRVCVAKYRNTTNFASSSSTPVNFDTLVNDTHAAVTTSASAWKFVAPISGFFDVTGCYSTSSSTTNLQLYKNGSFYEYLMTVSSATSQMSFATVVQLNAGEYIDLRTSSSVSSDGATAGCVYVNISRRSGPSVIAATESVNAQVRLATNQTTSGIIKFDTVLSDTHGSYSTATGLYTCAVSGRFRVSATLNGNATYTPYVGHNGTAYASLASTTSTTISNGSTTVKCNAGDTLGVYSNGVSVTVAGDSGAPSQAMMCIERTGN